MGKQLMREHHHLVTASEIIHFIQAIGEEQRTHLYFDQRSGRYKAPVLFCQAFAFDDVPIAELEEDLSPVEIKSSVPAKRTVGGSSDYQFFLPVWEGDQIQVRSQLLGCNKKEGRTGTLYLLQVETCFENQRKEAVAREVATYVKR